MATETRSGAIDLTINAKLAPIKRRLRAAVGANDAAAIDACRAELFDRTGERRWLEQRQVLGLELPGDCRRKFYRREEDRDGDE